MARPLFIMGTVPLYALGITAARHDGETIQVPLIVAGLFLVWLIQLMTHYNNEYCDLQTDLATEMPTRISGGSRVLVRKLVPGTVARIAAVAALLLAVVLAIVTVFIFNAGFWLPGLAGAAIFLGWFYSAKPLRLESRGWGETAIMAVSCFLLPITSYYLQSSIVRPSLLIACAPLGLLTLALILTTEIPDFDADKATGKRTLVVRLGKAHTMWLIMASLGIGWLIFVGTMISMWPFWGWILALVSLSMMSLVIVNLRAASKRHIASLEKAGLLISLLVGYASICLNIMFVIT